MADSSNHNEPASVGGNQVDTSSELVLEQPEKNLCGMCYYEAHRDTSVPGWDIGVGCTA